MSDYVIWKTWNAEYHIRKDELERVCQEQEQRRLELAAAQRLAAEEREKIRLAANGKAEKLLLSCLSPEQRDTYQKKGLFYLYTKSGKRYRIEKGRSGNVRLVNDKDVILKRYCIHPIEQVPDQDTMLAQALLLQSNEAEFLRVANAS